MPAGNWQASPKFSRASQMSHNTRSLRWAVAGLLFLSTGINYLDRQTLSILAATVQAELNIDDVGYATITSYFLLSYTVMYAISGGLVDLVGGPRCRLLCPRKIGRRDKLPASLADRKLGSN